MNIENNKVLEIISGSHLYGTATPASDKDLIGIFIGDELIYFGLEIVEEADLSIKDKTENNKNTKDAIDRKFYEIRRFVKLACQNNPSFIEILFVNKENILFVNSFGRQLLDSKHLFPCKGAAHRFMNYAISQKHKMYIKRDNIIVLRRAFDFFQREITNQATANKLLAEYRGINLEFITFYTNNCTIGDLSFSLKVKIKDVAGKIQNRIDKFTNRVSIIDSMGFDGKFGSHLIRLMLEGLELLETGNIEFPLKDRNLLTDIKNGKYTLKEVVKISEELEKQITYAETISKLPDKPQYDEINSLLIKIIKTYLF
ncbi:MAG: nucleotidyltransferase domain-containing protein [Nitrospirae bacterium]|nr:nucleotidyltransferase domain-containing protein [Nitrospirota bacterium]